MTQLVRAIFAGLLIVIALALFGIYSLLFAASLEYDRHSYGGWIDADGDCLNTRHEVLQAESLIPARIIACKVVRGLWYDLFTGETFTNPKALDVDHVVPLKEAEVSGAENWSSVRKRLYANDLTNPGHLMAVKSSVNRSKGSRDLAEWLPPNASFHCAYVKMWKAIKGRWGLSMDKAEQETATRVLATCN